MEGKSSHGMERNGKRKVRRHLPPGKGPYTVGTVDLMCGHTENGSFFRLFYPTNDTDIYKRDRQWPLWIPRRQYGIGYMYFLGRNPKIFGKLFNWLGGDVYVPALWQAPVLQNGKKFPVIVLSHGLGGNRTTYTTLCLELASQGFIIAAVEHRDGSASMTLCLRESFRHSVRHVDDNNHSHHHHRNSFSEDWKIFDKPKHIQWDDFNYRNKQVHQRARECSRVLDILKDLNDGKPLYNSLGIIINTSHFKDTMDITQASIIGHSFGGATCVCALADDERFKAGVVLDGWMHPLDDKVYKTVSQPILMLNMETFQWRKNVQQMMRLKADNVERQMLTIKGTCHQSVSDFQFLTNKAMGRLFNLRNTLTPHVAMDIIRCGTLGFLWKHLGQDCTDSCTGNQFEDVLMGTREHVVMGTLLDLS
ncbi:platelet-activating factor acetylhydrolase-like [Haliotis cracherodii]|uniref:platelet-activating factor acetylhydrolase-like n=1 Tax=Haliotis cracherodii TaxID=6455 RepID=UPI0039E7DF70